MIATDASDEATFFVNGGKNRDFGDFLKTFGHLTDFGGGLSLEVLGKENITAELIFFEDTRGGGVVGVADEENLSDLFVESHLREELVSNSVMVSEKRRLVMRNQTGDERAEEKKAMHSLII